MRIQEPNHKYCQRCRTSKHRSEFSVIQVKVGFRKDALCVPCRKAKTDVAAAVKARKIAKVPTGYQKEIQFQSELRKRELALIPNPFQKSEFIVPEILNYHWLAVV